MLSNYPIPAMLLRSFGRMEPEELIDGAQRTSTMNAFLNNELKVPMSEKKLPGIRELVKNPKSPYFLYSDLNDKGLKFLNGCHVLTRSMYNLTDEDVRRIFQRMNFSKSQTRGEQIHGINNDMVINLQELAQVANSKLLSGDTYIQDRRYKMLDKMATALYILYQIQSKSQNILFTFQNVYNFCLTNGDTAGGILYIQKLIQMFSVYRSKDLLPLLTACFDLKENKSIKLMIRNYEIMFQHQALLQDFDDLIANNGSCKTVLRSAGYMWALAHLQHSRVQENKYQGQLIREMVFQNEGWIRSQSAQNKYKKIIDVLLMIKKWRQDTCTKSDSTDSAVCFVCQNQPQTTQWTHKGTGVDLLNTQEILSCDDCRPQLFFYTPEELHGKKRKSM